MECGYSINIVKSTLSVTISPLYVIIKAILLHAVRATAFQRNTICFRPNTQRQKWNQTSLMGFSARKLLKINLFTSHIIRVGDYIPVLILCSLIVTNRFQENVRRFSGNRKGLCFKPIVHQQAAGSYCSTVKGVWRCQSNVKIPPLCSVQAGRGSVYASWTVGFVYHRWFFSRFRICLSNSSNPLWHFCCLMILKWYQINNKLLKGHWDSYLQTH